MIKIYNSLTKNVEEFIPIKENEITMYVCGPTVYNYMHIGNSRPVIFFDTVARFFKYLGYKVKYVSNFTDIDDKIIARAKEENITEAAVSEKYIKEISQTYQRLNCLPHDANPKVTENMDEIIDFIQLLITKGGAYVVDGDVYFSVEKIDDYGILSSQTIENLMNGARIEPNDKKNNPIDFTLWKETHEGRRWPSPWSEGRPGWHTECVVMIQNIFKGKIDIHGGGLDLKFPHHDNEIAQSICAHDHKIANYWMHNGRIDLSGEKMSKSIGNVIWANELLDKIDFQVYRLMILNVPYRQPLNYKEDLLEQAQNDYEKIRRAYNNLFRKLELANEIVEKINDEEIATLKDEFITAMKDDLNTANAITTIFKITKLANNLVRDQELNLGKMASVLDLFTDMLWVLGIETNVKALTKDEVSLVQEYHQARKEKNYALSDELRDIIMAKGILL